MNQRWGCSQRVEKAAMREPNLEKLNALVGKLVGDLGISLGGASILLGDRLGLYKAMADGVAVTPSELAKKTGLHERYVREWLSGQAFDRTRGGLGAGSGSWRPHHIRAGE